MKTKKVSRDEVNKIFLFVPNIIGYVRIALSVLSFLLAFKSPVLFSLMYATSFLLDGLDGYAARSLNQCTKFGAVLDMVVDRVSTAGLTIVLSHLYPNFLFAFILLCMLDFTSHWIRMYSSLVTGSDSHKDVREDQHFLLKHYYGNRNILGLLCIGNEFFYIFAYLHAHFASFSLWFGCLWLCFPIFALKQVINVIQLHASSYELVEWEVENKPKN
eukprot:TRINITY_DN2138_c0_g1_i1.p1 TRINITY_DN2138_c0_g1~~TRINITY_DN2138_c0_g1_i1.p1  ORF type:complete len:216 (+),score=40.20 TRINITY_DN2138_c0_g1_i1:71-718(+)